MPFLSRLALFGACCLALGFFWHWFAAAPVPTDQTVSQLHDAAALEQLRHQTTAQNARFFALPVALGALAGLMFWEDLKKLLRPAEQAEQRSVSCN